MIAIITVILAGAVLWASYPVTMPLTLSVLLIAAIWPVKVWLDRWIGRASYVGASIVLLFLLALFLQHSISRPRKSSTHSAIAGEG
jgi:AI-2 transport protein TqsA